MNEQQRDPESISPDEQPPAEPVSPQLELDNHVTVGASKRHYGRLLFLSILLLLVAAALAYFLVIKTQSVTAPATHETKSLLPTAPIGHPVSAFYYSSGDSSINTVNLATGKKQTITPKLDEDRFFAPIVGYVDNTGQYASNGDKLFFESIKPKLPLDGGEGETERDSDLLSLWQNGRETKLLQLKVAEGVTLSDWVVTPDGKTVYYMAGSLSKDKNAGSGGLYSLDVSSKQSKLIKADITNVAGINSPLFLTRNGALLFFLPGDNYGLTEYSVVNGKYTVKPLGQLACKCSLSSISPDGEKLLMEEQTSGTVPSDFSYYVMDIATTRLNKIAGPLRNITWLPTLWSPDSKQIMFSTNGFSNDPYPYESKTEIINVASGQIQSIPAASGGINGHLLSWSTDGQYVAYIRNDKLNLFDLVHQKLVGSPLPVDAFTTYSVGWY